MLIVFLHFEFNRGVDNNVKIPLPCMGLSLHFLSRSIEMGVYKARCTPPVSTTFTRSSSTPLIIKAPDLDPMDLGCSWRRPLVYFARGLYACLLALLYLFISRTLCSYHHKPGTEPPSHLQASPGKETSGPISTSTVGGKPAGTTLVGFDTHAEAHDHTGGQSPAVHTQEGRRFQASTLG
jgi:hypothetical protein